MNLNLFVFLMFVGMTISSCKTRQGELKSTVQEAGVSEQAGFIGLDDLQKALFISDEYSDNLTALREHVKENLKLDKNWTFNIQEFRKSTRGQKSTLYVLFEKRNIHSKSMYGDGTIALLKAEFGLPPDVGPQIISVGMNYDDFTIPETAEAYPEGRHATKVLFVDEEFQKALKKIKAKKAIPKGMYIELDSVAINSPNYIFTFTRALSSSDSSKKKVTHATLTATLGFSSQGKEKILESVVNIIPIPD